ncbi:hypothetical protein CDG76_30695 [Nostoc sp. 'Peltigera membranacea cyanobiont' 210A]|nr:hypothetical protein CDG76_30695 [Nostoc sp. 'Peltigera membranacea cyanobiont' 210A]
MQSALNCAGKCDCCDKLQQQINAINARLSSVKNIDENALKTSIKASLQPDLFTAVAAAGVVITNKLQPQVEAIRKTASDAFLEAVENTKKQKLLEIEQRGVSETATRAERNAAEYARQMRLAQQELTAAKGEQARLNRVNKSLELADTELRELNTKNTREAERLATIERKNAGKFKALEDTAIAAKREAELAKGLSNQAISKSAEAVTESITASTKAATAGRDALNLSTEISGLRGVVNGFGAKLNAFGRAVATLEKAVGDALVTAAEAVGISKGALAATGRLAGQVLQIFNVIGTIFTILDGMATRIVLGERIDAVENAVVALGSDLSRVLGKLLGFQNRIGANEALTAQVKNIALDAKGIGEAAKLQAGAAQVTSARAQGIAESALGNAKQAQLTSDGAVRNAAIANENATTAYKQGVKAEGIGQQAAKLGGQALEKAGQALALATTAIATVQLVRSLQGLRGLKGDKGDKGDRGFQGAPGILGRDGITTVVQLPGRDGKDGKNGRDGKSGFPGRDGKDGKDMGQAEVFELKAFIATQHQQTQGVLGNAIAGIKASVNTGFATVVNASSAVVNGANLALLNVVNAKLGTQVTGGIGGLITKIAENSYIDKALAVLTFATTLHNALMLTNNLAQTLGSIINTVLGLVLPKGLDGNPIEIGAVIGKTTTGASQFCKKRVRRPVYSRL